MRVMEAFVSVAALLCVSAVAGPLAPTKPGTWSEPVSGLAGRLRVAEPTIATDQHFRLTLELANRGHVPLAVQVNPRTLTITVLDGAGEAVRPASSAGTGFMSSPPWTVIPGEAYHHFGPLSSGRPEGSQLRSTPLTWKLPPGKYRIAGGFSSGSAKGLVGSPGKATVWEGKIELPPIDVEVIEKQ